MRISRGGAGGGDSKPGGGEGNKPVTGGQSGWQFCYFLCQGSMFDIH